MKLRLAFAFVLTAALAAAQGVKVAGDGAPPPTVPAPQADATPAAAPADAAPKPGAPKKKSAKSKKKHAPIKKKPEEESKFKTRALSGDAGSHYRYDENGNPIVDKKKSSAKSKKSSSSDDSVEKAACTDDAPCVNRKTTEADSL